MRIFYIYAYLFHHPTFMKKRLNITVDGALMEQAKRYAAKNNSSLSQMVEVYFKSLTRPTRKKNAIEVLKTLPKPKQTVNGDLKEQYFDKEKKKYGF